MNGLIEYAPLDTAQAGYIRRSKTAWLNVAEGGKRAGKNVINIIAWAAAIDASEDALHLAAGVSQSSAKMNIIDSDGFGLEHIFAGRCALRQYNGREALVIDTAKGEKAVIIAGGGDSRSASLIKGHSYGSVYITEANECHKSFVMEAMDRTLASKKRQVFFDLNPKPPAHWFYSEFLDYQDKLKARGGNPGYNYGHFTIANNRSINDDAMRDVLSKYDRGSIWYQRDILGKRTSASGRIYTGYSRDDCSVTPEAIRGMKFAELSIGVDVGGTDATVATLAGITQGYERVVLIDGMYHKQGIDNKMDETAYCRMIADWLVPWASVYGGLVCDIHVDSANKLFIAGLRRELERRGLSRFSVKGFDKGDGILQRIELTCMLLAQGRYVISSRMEKWHEAMQMATWDDKAFMKGEWVRTDDGSYPVDCLDSGEYAFYGMKRYLV